MKLFFEILLCIIAMIALIIGGFLLKTKLSSRPGPQAQPLTALSSSALQTAIEGIAAERKLVGVAAKVMVDGTVIAEAQAGWRTKEHDSALRASDLFHIGSIGKSMSATAIAALVEGGTMGWDDTLSARLPDVAMHDGWRDVTLAQLLTHTASIPRAPLAAMMNATREPDALRAVRRETAAIILEDPPEIPPGTAFSYSNEGYMLASVMAEGATGEPWEDIIQTRLAAPLNLSTLGFGAPRGETTADVPWGHRKIGAIKLAMSPIANADNPAWMAAAGTMHMTLDDLLTYGRTHMDAGSGATAILTAQTFTRLHTPVMNDYAFGWIAQSRDFGAGVEPVLWHNGSNTMWYALLVLLPDRDMAIVIATNDGGDLDDTRRSFDELAKQIATAGVLEESRVIP